MSKFFKQQGLILDGEDFNRVRNSDMENRKLQDEINGLKKKKTGDCHFNFMLSSCMNYWVHFTLTLKTLSFRSE